MQELCSSVSNKAFRHVETLLVQGNQVRTDQNKYPFLLIKKVVCFDQYKLDYLGRIKFLHVEMPYWFDYHLTASILYITIYFLCVCELILTHNLSFACYPIVLCYE